MKIQLTVKGRNKETQEEEEFTLNLPVRNVACLYSDRYGVAVSTTDGKLYRVSETMQQLRSEICLE